ncbi:hypothetical protein [Alysiella crassa]|nr:hypothetical protein [Alysiella crassa]
MRLNCMGNELPTLCLLPLLPNNKTGSLKPSSGCLFNILIK